MRVQLYFRAVAAKSQGVSGPEGNGVRGELESLLDTVRTFVTEATQHASLSDIRTRFEETAHELQKIISQRRSSGVFMLR